MSDEDRLEELLLAWEDAFDHGTDIQAAELCRDCPHLAERAGQEIAKLKRLRPAAEEAPIPSPTKPMGPPPPPVRAFAGLRFEPRRHHASGGLGDVFVAIDQEVGREVALKRMQPRHADDSGSRARFEREAEITGRLEHPGVVPLYGRGRDADGRPYYAMRFIRGRSLRHGIEEFYKPDNAKKDPGERAVAFRGLLQSFVGACNTVAYAHSRAVIHRDLKPDNIMLGPYGETLVVDWGLAKYVGPAATTRDPAEESVRPTALPEGEATQTGAAVGTPAFISPEQALGHKEVGPASDVFSLGATLYQLLTGRPPYQGWQALVDAAAGTFPPPRHLRRDVPRALEAVCLKAMAFRPEDRYATAQDLARDVDRWLAEEPTTAYREPWGVRVGRWVKRHRTPVTATVAALLVAALLVGGGLWWKSDQDARAAAAAAAAERDLVRHVHGDVEEAADWQEEGHWEEARAALGRANGRLGDGGPEELRRFVGQAEANLEAAFQAAAKRQAEARDQEVRSGLAGVGRLRDRGRFGEAGAVLKQTEARLSGGGPAELVDGLNQARQDLDMAAELDEAPLLGTRSSLEGGYDWEAVAQRYRELFRNYGIDLAALDPAEAASRIRASDIHEQLIVALDYWASKLPTQDGERARLVDTAGRAERDDRRKTLRAAWSQSDQQELERQLDGMDISSLPPAIAVAITDVLMQKESGTRAEQILRAVQHFHPNDFWVNHALCETLLKTPGRREEALGFLRASLAVKPDSPGAHYNLGCLLGDEGRREEEEKEFRRAIELKDDYLAAHSNLGVLLKGEGRREEAEKEFRRAIQIKDIAILHTNLGNLLAREEGRREEAEKEFRRALELKDEAPSHYNLGILLALKGREEEAMKECRRAIELKDDFEEAHYELGCLLITHAGNEEEAEKEFLRAVQLKDDDDDAHNKLGILLAHAGHREDAVKEFRRAIQIKDEFAEAHVNLGILLADTGHREEAKKEYRRAIQLKDDDAQAHNNLGALLADEGSREEAEKEYRRALELKDDDALTHNNLGKLLAAMGRRKEAEKEYRRAIQFQDDYVEAHCNLGSLLNDEGQQEEAEKEYRRAIQLKDDDAVAHKNLGLLLADMGRRGEAEKEFRRAIQLKEDLAEAHDSLGSLLADEGQQEEAEKEYRRAIQIKDDFAEAHNDLGYLLIHAGHREEAEKEFRRAIQIKEDYVEAHVNLGLLLRNEGQFGEAMPCFQRALELLPPQDPRRGVAQRNLSLCHRLMELDEKLPAVLKGDIRPKGAEKVEFALLCQYKARYAAAARLYTEAFAEQSALADDLKAGNRYNAARAAALAAAGKGEDADKLDDKERVRLRQQALGWLRDDLSQWSTRVPSIFPAVNAGAVKVLQHWIEDADLASVRDKDALDKLPESERAEWQKFWSDVDALLKKTSDARQK